MLITLGGCSEFANEKPIGDNMAFLALQIANTYGQDKIALDQRVQWVEDNEEIILLCGENIQAPRCMGVLAQGIGPISVLAAV